MQHRIRTATIALALGLSSLAASASTADKLSAKLVFDVVLD